MRLIFINVVGLFKTALFVLAPERNLFSITNACPFRGPIKRLEVE